MNLEIQYIAEILHESEVGLKTSEIARIIRNKHNHRITRTKVKHYLWSYFANDIDINDEYQYTLKNNVTKLDKIETIQRNQPRAICFVAEGSTLKAYYSNNLKLDNLVYAIAAVSANVNPISNTTDLTVRINREIDSLQ